MRVLFLECFLVISVLARVIFSLIQCDTCKNEYIESFVVVAISVKGLDQHGPLSGYHHN